MKIKRVTGKWFHYTTVQLITINNHQRGSPRTNTTTYPVSIPISLAMNRVTAYRHITSARSIVIVPWTVSTTTRGLVISVYVCGGPIISVCVRAPAVPPYIGN